METIFIPRVMKFATAEVVQVFLLIFSRIRLPTNQRSHHDSRPGHWTNSKRRVVAGAGGAARPHAPQWTCEALMDQGVDWPIGIICVAIMSNPWTFGSGIFFDTRTIILSLGAFSLVSCRRQ